MTDYSVNIQLATHRLGDKWVGISAIGPVTIGDDALQPDNALTRVRMHFKKGSDTFRLDSDAGENPDAPIVITDAATWEANVPEVMDFVTKSGKWKWDMEFYQTGESSPLTFYHGTLEVTSDVTN